MRRALASAPAVEPPASQLTAYAAYLARAGHGNSAYEQAARSFVRRWPDPQAWAARPLSAKLQANGVIAENINLTGTPTFLFRKPDGSEGRLDGLPADMNAFLAEVAGRS